MVKKNGVDRGARVGVPSEVAAQMKAVEQENRELRQANEILRRASAYFAQTGARLILIGDIEVDGRLARMIEPALGKPLNDRGVIPLERVKGL